jgi:hypothetical protein
MNNEAALTDTQFLERVTTGRIETFGHREHLRLAYLAVRAGGSIDDVIDRCRSGIQAVATAKGAPDTYDEAITTSWARAMLGAVSALPSATFDELLEQRPELLRPLRARPGAG